MVNDILTAAGVQHREVRFIQPPAGTYAVWFDSQDHRGSDSNIRIIGHETRIELYSPKIDASAEAAIEEQFQIRGQAFFKDDRLWLKDEQKFMTVYSFEYLEKRR